MVDEYLVDQKPMIYNFSQGIIWDRFLSVVDYQYSIFDRHCCFLSWLFEVDYESSICLILWLSDQLCQSIIDQSSVFVRFRQNRLKIYLMWSYTTTVVIYNYVVKRTETYRLSNVTIATYTYLHIQGHKMSTCQITLCLIADGFVMIACGIWNATIHCLVAISTLLRVLYFIQANL